MLGSLLDSSAWIAMVMTSHSAHAEIQSLAEKATLAEPLVFCRSTQQSFLRLVTTPLVTRGYGVPALTNSAALAAYDSLVSRPTVVEWEERSGVVAVWRQLAECDSASPKVWMDAYLAAFAITSDLRLVSADKDFRKYEPHGLDFHLLK